MAKKNIAPPIHCLTFGPVGPLEFASVCDPTVCLSDHRACLLNAPATVLYTTLACLTGLAIFATYAECDPLQVGLVEKKDQVSVL